MAESIVEAEIQRYVVIEKSVKGLGVEKTEEFFDKTGLEDFRVSIFKANPLESEMIKSEESLLKEASRVVVVKGGWDSDRKVLEDLAEALIKKDPNAVVLMIDHVGQRESRFKNPEVILRDTNKETLEFNLEATKLGMEFLGYSDEQILSLNKNLVKIGHSRGAASGLFDTEALENPNIKYIFLAPVLGHDGFNPAVAKLILPLSITTARFVYRNAELLDPIADAVRNILITYYVGTKHQKMISRYINNFEHTDKIVLARFISNLYDQKFPDLQGKIDSNRHRFYVYRNDKFVDKNNMLKEIKKGIGEDAYNQCVNVYDGDHHAFLDSDNGSNDDILNFVCS